MLKLSTDTYSLTPSGQMLLNSTKPYLFICGPVGSGKTTASILTLIERACSQPLFNGVRRSRVCILRKFIPELKATAIKSFLELFPETRMNYSFPISGILEMDNAAGEHIYIEIYFLSAQRKEDVRKLLSFELTWAWINEANQMPPEVFAACQDRVGRYPPVKKGGVANSGVICDTNAFPTNHWLKQNHYTEFPVLTPDTGDYIETENQLIIRQPPAIKMFNSELSAQEYVDSLNDYELSLVGQHNLRVHRSLSGMYFVLHPHADNLKNLPVDYYTRAIESKTSPDIRVKYMNHLMSDAISDKACYPMFDIDRHVTDITPKAFEVQKIILGWDFGLTPTCVLCYVYDNPTKVIVIDEVMGVDMGLTRFVPMVLTMLSKYDIDVKHTLSAMDPAGTIRSQSNEQKCFDVLTHYGFNLGGHVPQTLITRLESVRKKLYSSGTFLINRRCEFLIQGFVADYKFSEANAERGILKPDKNINSHFHDALQYAMELVDLLDDSEEAEALDSIY